MSKIHWGPHKTKGGLDTLILFRFGNLGWLCKIKNLNELI